MNIASIITGIIILILGLDAVAQRVTQIGRKRVLHISYTNWFCSSRNDLNIYFW